jgi:RND family efflux transporter MFP subunit
MSKFSGGGRIAIAVLLILSYVGYQFYERKQAADALSEETLEDAVETVAIIHPKPGKPTETITLPGTIDAWFQAPIFAQVSGYVEMWYKDYGAHVKKGEVLAIIQAPALDAQFKQSKADMESERAKYELAVVTAKRYVALRKSQAVSEQSITVQLANEKMAQAELNAALQNIKNYEAKIKFKTIVAPYDGVVTQRNINVGDYINSEGNISGTTVSNLFSVADIHKMRLFISVPGPFARILKPNLTADVTVPQIADRNFTAKFLTSANGFDPNTRTVTAEFTIDNDDHALWPGSYATVRLTGPSNTHILTIPSSSMVFEEKGTEVATVTDDNRIHLKSITVGKILDGSIEVVDGITEADRIVDNPSAALLEGDKVRIVTPAPGYDLDAHSATEL